VRGSFDVPAEEARKNGHVPKAKRKCDEHGLAVGTSEHPEDPAGVHGGVLPLGDGEPVPGACLVKLKETDASAGGVDGGGNEGGLGRGVDHRGGGHLDREARMRKFPLDERRHRALGAREPALEKIGKQGVPPYPTDQGR
jgi:hypothetical protein